jgi:tetratricopeptide (TPR) repeat protein
MPKSGPVKKSVAAVTFCALVAFAAVPAAAQTFEIGGKPTSATEKKKPSPGTQRQLGWGSSIEVGRLARAAQAALRQGRAAAAADYAQRAVKQAPNDPKLWFLLGYTSRLAGRAQVSLDAYQQGLKRAPNSVEGLAGMAQTYMRMGRNSEAQQLLMRIVRAHPNRVHELTMAGELFLRTGDLQQGLNLLQRANNLRPSARSELLMATAYLRLKQPAKARELLERARRRDPNNTQIFRAVATYHREVHDYKAAIETLQAAPRKSPEILGDLAYSYELAGERELSAQTYGKAADADRARIGFQLSAAQAFMRVGDAEKAKSYLARAAAIDGDHYRLHAIRGAMARGEDRVDDAVASYAQALAKMPESVPEGLLYPIQLRLNLSELYRDTGNDAAAKQQIVLAEQQMSRIQVEGPARAEFLRVRASVKNNGGDLQGAEADLTEALKLDPTNTNARLQYANLLWRTKRRDEARGVYNAVLKGDPANRFALESLGYLAREESDIKGAELYFSRLAAAHPTSYVGHLALGDMYTSLRDFEKANASYQKAFQLAPKNPIIVANGANAAIEARQFELAGAWVERATGVMNDDPRVMRERERYLFHTGNYREAAQLGFRVLEKLPRDRNASVYLAYALYNLGRYDDVLSLTSRYENILPKEANFPLLAGHVHKQSQLLHRSVDDYTRAIERDPRMIEAYLNRGYVLNDLQNAEAAIADFSKALELNPKNGIAHLGLSFSNLQLRRGKPALEHVDLAAKFMGESGATHLARATAFRQQRQLDRAEKEYRVALKFSPNDFRLHMALADTLYHLRRHHDAIAVLTDALRLAPDDPGIYSSMAFNHARLGHERETYQYIGLAEKLAQDQSAILLRTGDALMALGQQDAAMERFVRAMQAPDANRVDVRLAIARLFVREGQWEDARQQVALAFAESRIGEASPVTADNLVEAGNIFLGINDFDLARRYFERAKLAGAGDQAVAIGLANAYLAVGDDRNAEAQLAALGDPADFSGNYDYMMVRAAIFRQRRDNLRALSAFARANTVAGSDTVAERRMQEVAGEVGMKVHRRFSVLSDISLQALMENATIYMIDARLLGVDRSDPSLMPGPRSSMETRATSAFRFYQPGIPVVSGFFQVRNARGVISLPSENLIVRRNTYDTAFNGGINPTLRLGNEYFTFNTGVQFTLRRDALSPFIVNQNLFRQFVHLSTSAIGNWVTVRGNAFHEAGDFTNRRLSSQEVGASLEFTVGRPWGRTALVTGYTVRDLQFEPLIREFFSTSSYVGVQRRFGRGTRVRLLGEYIRSWRVQDLNFATAQALRPVLDAEVRIGNRWAVEGSVAYTRGQGFHAYDNIQSGFLISYVKPVRRTFEDGIGEVPVEYPLRFSIGLEQQNFFGFAGRGQTTLRPVFRLTLF